MFGLIFVSQLVWANICISLLVWANIWFDCVTWRPVRSRSRKSVEDPVTRDRPSLLLLLLLFYPSLPPSSPILSFSSSLFSYFILLFLLLVLFYPSLPPSSPLPSPHWSHFLFSAFLNYWPKFVYLNLSGAIFRMAHLSQLCNFFFACTFTF